MLLGAIALGAAMLPAAWPALRLLRQLGGRAELLAFGAAYLAVWLVLSGVVMLVEVPAGPGLTVAGLYQLGPLQSVSLRLCRSPLGLLVRRSAPRAGVEYALACAGCCAGLMLALVALGTMTSAVWMGSLVALVLAEKLLRHGVLFGRVAGVALIAGAVGVLL